MSSLLGCSFVLVTFKKLIGNGEFWRNMRIIKKRYSNIPIKVIFMDNIDLDDFEDFEEIEIENLDVFEDFNDFFKITA